MKNFFKTMPVTILIASGLMLFLIVLTGVFQFTNLGMSYGGRPGGEFTPGQLPDGASLPEDFTPPEGGQRPEGGTRPSGSGDFQPGDMPDNGDGFQRGNFGGDETSMKLMQLLRGIQAGASILIMALGLVALTGMLLLKKWGATWAIVTSILAMIAALPDLLQRMAGADLIGTIAKLILAAAILVLCFLTKPRPETTAA